MTVGSFDGIVVGFVGLVEGLVDGRDDDGLEEGDLVGVLVGLDEEGRVDGFKVGCLVGRVDGFIVV